MSNKFYYYCFIAVGILAIVGVCLLAAGNASRCHEKGGRMIREFCVKADQILD